MVEKIYIFWNELEDVFKVLRGAPPIPDQCEITVHFGFTACLIFLSRYLPLQRFLFYVLLLYHKRNPAGCIKAFYYLLLCLKSYLNLILQSLRKIVIKFISKSRWHMPNRCISLRSR